MEHGGTLMFLTEIVRKFSTHHPYRVVASYFFWENFPGKFSHRARAMSLNQRKFIGRAGKETHDESDPPITRWVL